MDDKLNLAEASQALFGGKAELKIVDPQKLTLLKKNARFMRKTMFDQLVNNLQTDDMLSSVPLCHTTADGEIEVLSGNHRVSAAIEAGFPQILILLLLKEVSEDRKVAIQLSHNQINGEDDKVLLAELVGGIKDLETRLYTGFDSRELDEVGKIDFSGFSPESIPTELISLWFLPEDVENFEALLADSLKVFAAKKIFLAPLDGFKKTFETLVAVKKNNDIKSTAVAFVALLHLARERLEQLLDENNAFQEEHAAVAKQARGAIRSAIRGGHIVKPAACSSCGKDCVPEGHHPDYSKPLEVEWLCTSCHNRVHRGAVLLHGAPGDEPSE